MRSPTRTPAGTRRIWSRSISSRAKSRTAGHCARSSGSPPLRPTVISSRQIVPVELPGKKGPTLFDKDEHNRPDTTLETLARLKPRVSPERHHHRRQRARTERCRRGDGARRQRLGREDAASRRQRAWSLTASPRSNRACSAGTRARGQAGLAARRLGHRPTSSASKSMKPSRPSQSLSLASSGCPRTSSTSKAAPSPMAIRSAPPVQC